MAVPEQAARSRWSVIRTLWLGVAASVLLSACGGEDEQAAAVQLDTGRLGTITALTRGQYTQIKRVYVASLAADKRAASKAGSSEDPAAAFAPVLAACDAYDANDPLLAPLRAACSGLGAFTDAAVDAGECVSGRRFVIPPTPPLSDECRHSFSAAQARATRSSAGVRRAERAVRLTGLPPACKRALLTSRETTDAVARLARTLRLIERALRRGATHDDASAAVAALVGYQVDDDDDASSMTAQQQLDRLRRTCH